MMTLPDGQKGFKIGLAVETQYTVSQPASLSFDSKYRARKRRAGKNENTVMNDYER